VATQEHATKLNSYSKLFVGGHWREPSTDKRIEVVSPTTEETLASVPEAQAADIDAAVVAARRAFDEGPWPRMRPAERAAALRRVGAAIEERKAEIAATFTAEVGAPAAAGRAFHELPLVMWNGAADVLERFPFEEIRQTSSGAARLVREPVGVVGTITPWNAPVPNASIKAAPALAAGCTVVLKPAPEGPITAMMFAEAVQAADLPDGVISVLPAGREVGEHLVTHPQVDKVAFTGSTAAGRRIMSLCGERVARVTLELGGKSAGIIADDVDLNEFLSDLVFAGVGHSGQVCAALTRILVPRTRHDEIADAIAEIMRGIKVGDPTDPDTVLGPLAAERQRDRVESYFALGVQEGATLVTGGRRPADLPRGWFIEPTLFANVENSMRIAQEEIFGPVLCLIPFDGVDDAVRIANDSIYGLSGAVYARDVELAERIARSVRTGQIYINSWGMCVTEPFGGFKQSGLGREGGNEGLSAYLEMKLIEGLPLSS
jgi:acyl-CoA reductase-like NAD-dependent aldehyde dehydrogenase